jgi:hypothetical protein
MGALAHVRCNWLPCPHLVNRERPRVDTFHDVWRQAEPTRRKLIASGAASGFVAGFALSAQPVMAQTTIVTERSIGRPSLAPPIRRAHPTPGRSHAKRKLPTSRVRPLGPRRGAKKAIGPSAASILTAADHMIANGTLCQDIGADHFDRNSEPAQISVSSTISVMIAGR